MRIEEAHDFDRALWEVFQNFGTAYQAYARKVGVSCPTLNVLEELLHSDAITQRDICQQTFMPKQTVNSIVSSLERQGIVALSPSAQDHRMKTVCLTEKGYAWAESLLKPVNDAEIAALAQFDTEDAEKLVSLLKTFYIKYQEALQL